MTIVYLTAGAAGMYCGSCMHDNSLAKALIAKGRECLLVPTYTPIRTDEADASVDKVFFGGINVFLQQKFPWLAYLPRWMDSALNRPQLIRRLTAGAMKTDPKFLAALTVSMLRGMEGNQRKEVKRLSDWLAKDVRPNALIFSNLLIAGCIPEFRKRLKAKILVTLQGDDIFFESLPSPFREQAIEAMRRLVPSVDGFLVHSRDYGLRMAEILKIPEKAVHVVPLGIDTVDFENMSWNALEGPTRIGYLARMAPEKGLHYLVDAFIELNRRNPGNDSILDLAGWMGPQHQEYWQKQVEKLNSAGLSNRYTYHGSVDRQEKVRFLSAIDLLCVPTEYQEPKGLFVLEGIACGVPYLLPNHGAFPELHERLQFGSLFQAKDRDSLVQSLERHTQVPRLDVDERSRQRNARIEEIRIQTHADRVLAILDQA